MSRMLIFAMAIMLSLALFPGLAMAGTTAAAGLSVSELLALAGCVGGALIAGLVVMSG